MNSAKVEKPRTTKKAKLSKPRPSNRAGRSKSRTGREMKPPKSSANGAESNGGDGFKRRLLATASTLRDGDFSVRMPSDLTGLDGKVADTLNELASLMERSQLNLLHLRNEVGRKGR